MAKKVFTAILICTLALTFAVGASAKTLVYDAVADLFFFESGTTEAFNHLGAWDEELSGSGRLILAGGPDAYFEMAVLGTVITDRKNGWDSIDVVMWDFPIGRYIMEVDFGAFSPTTFLIEDADSPWGIFGQSEEGVTSALVTAHIEVADEGRDGGRNIYSTDDGIFQNRIRVKAGLDGALDDFFVKSIRIFSLQDDAVEFEMPEIPYDIPEPPAAGGDDDAGAGGGDADAGAGGGDADTGSGSGDAPANNNNDEGGSKVIFIIIGAVAVVAIIVIIVVVAKKKG